MVPRILASLPSASSFPYDAVAAQRMKAQRALRSIGVLEVFRWRLAANGGHVLALCVLRLFRILLL